MTPALECLPAAQLLNDSDPLDPQAFPIRCSLAQICQIRHLVRKWEFTLSAFLYDGNPWGASSVEFDNLYDVTVDPSEANPPTNEVHIACARGLSDSIGADPRIVAITLMGGSTPWCKRIPDNALAERFAPTFTVGLQAEEDTIVSGATIPSGHHASAATFSFEFMGSVFAVPLWEPDTNAEAFSGTLLLAPSLFWGWGGLYDPTTGAAF